MSTAGTPPARGSCADPAGPSEVGLGEAPGSRPCSEALPAPDVAGSKLGVFEWPREPRPGGRACKGAPLAGVSVSSSATVPN
eukprot:14278999-Alexandrium_andersonii.AAC.1